jgi:TrmH family RNA methyltransferase
MRIVAAKSEEPAGRRRYKRKPRPLWCVVYCRMHVLSPRADFDRLRVVLVNARNPLNIGAAARVMSNFGFMHLRVVNPYKVAFREARSAVGASELLASAEEFDSVGEAVADCTLVIGTTAAGRRQLQHPVRGLEEGARMIRKRLAASRVALLFGSERIGLRNDDMSHCHWLMRIPTREEHGSVNLGQAVAICLYEIARGLGVGPALAREKERAATGVELARIDEVMLEVLRLSGFVKPRASVLAEEKLRRLIRRLKLSTKDAEVWLGMMRHILWKLQAGRDSAE